MKRKFLFSFYETPQGKLLQMLEKKYLKRSITVGCKQTILQVGAVKWESEFIDCSLFTKFTILDSRSEGSTEAVKICGKAYRLPIQSETIDLVILPHLLEFDAHRFQTMREVERVLKPEGELIILNLNPLNIWVRLLFVWNKKMSYSWKSTFLSRSRVADWLKLLNFEIKTTSEFTLDSVISTPGYFQFGKNTFLSMAYAVRAIKRQYTLIPLAPVRNKVRGYATAASGLKSATHRKNTND